MFKENLRVREAEVVEVKVAHGGQGAGLVGASVVRLLGPVLDCGKVGSCVAGAAVAEVDACLLAEIRVPR